MIKENKQFKSCSIAWQGWRMPVSPDWQPMRIEGDYKKGSMIIGNSEAPLMQVSWYRFKEDNEISVSTWLSRRFGNISESFSRRCPKPEGFDDIGWVKDMEIKQGNTKSVWVGVSKIKRILIDIMFTNLTPESERDKIIIEYLPELEVFGKEEMCPWSIYQVSFSVPGEYELIHSHLYSGDIALEFQRKRGDRLMVRQVYPSKLALSRRSLKRWLEVYPFKESRKYKIDRENSWNGNKNYNNGLHMQGRKQIAFPLGWIRRRFCSSIIVQDEELDRLLIAEHASINGTDDDMLYKIIAGMNSKNV